jgi:UDP-N-acetylmuramate dehydrogenase
MTLLEHSPIKSKENEPLNKHTSMRIGGNALWMSWPEQVEEVLCVLDWCYSQELPFYFIGRGSNLLVSDDGFPGMVINLLNFEKDRFSASEEQVEVSAGMTNNAFIQECLARGLGGMEFLASIPGSVGASCVQNAGFSLPHAKKTEVSEFIEQVTILDLKTKQKRTLNKDQLSFSYRDSSLREHLVLGVRFRCSRKSKEEIQASIHANYSYRSEIQDLQHPSAGSVFKNPDNFDLSAGQMVDRLGMKGFRVGDAQISERHGNFFINRGKATCREMTELIFMVKEKVKKEFGIQLEEEIRYV